MDAGGRDDATGDAVGFPDAGGLAVDGGLPAGEGRVGEDDHAGAAHVGAEADTVGGAGEDFDFVAGAVFELGRFAEENGLLVDGEGGDVELGAEVREGTGGSGFVDDPGAGAGLWIAEGFEAGFGFEERRLFGARGLFGDVVGDGEDVLRRFGMKLGEVERFGDAGDVAAEDFEAMIVAEVEG